MNKYALIISIMFIMGNAISAETDLMYEILGEQAGCIEITNGIKCPDFFDVDSFGIMFVENVTCFSSDAIDCSGNIDCANAMDLGCIATVNLERVPNTRQYTTVNALGEKTRGSETAGALNTTYIDVFIDPMIIDFSKCEEAGMSFFYDSLSCDYSGKSYDAEGTAFIDFDDELTMVVFGIKEKSIGSFLNNTVYLAIILIIAIILTIYFYSKKKKGTTIQVSNTSAEKQPSSPKHQHARYRHRR